MPAQSTASPFRRLTLASALAFAAAASTGCQLDVGGQTLPSPYYLSDDVQYFPPGPEFKLAREAAAIETLKADQLEQQSGRRTAR